MAHDGPAFPILVDKSIGKIKLSIWADPDTFKGTFDLFLEGNSLSLYRIELTASPVNDSSHQLKVEALPLQNIGDLKNFRAILPFDREVMWNVQFSLKQSDGAENTIIIPISVTPPGPNKFEFALYFLPFLLAGLIWVRVTFAKRKHSTSKKSNSEA